MISAQERRIPQAGQGDGAGLPYFMQSSGVYMSFMPVVEEPEDRASILVFLVFIQF